VFKFVNNKNQDWLENGQRNSDALDGVLTAALYTNLLLISLSNMAPLNSPFSD